VLVVNYEHLDSFLRSFKLQAKQIAHDRIEYLKLVERTFPGSGPKTGELLGEQVELVALDKERGALLLGNASYTVTRYYYCTCRDFYFSNVLRATGRPCKHILALIFYDLSEES
jgi:hypothetical protein